MLEGNAVIFQLTLIKKYYVLPGTYHIHTNDWCTVGFKSVYQNPDFWFVQIMDPMCAQNTLALHCVDQAPGLCLKKEKVFD